MQLLDAIKKLNKLDSDIEKLGNWFADLNVNSKPITGKSWIIIKKSIDNAIDEIVEERNALEEKVVKATEGIRINDAKYE